VDSTIYILAAFLCGSLPFSVWLGKMAFGVDVRKHGDGNPGAYNAFKAGNAILGFIILILDISKAAAPVGLAYFNLNFRGLSMFFIAIAPVLGHVFSPFLRFKGGKALAAVLGVWIGLTIWKASLPAVVAVATGVMLFSPPGWSVVLALGAILATLLIWLPDPLLLSVWLAVTLILLWTHREDLRSLPKLRPWVKRIFQR
jgi:glycerol-3-phosphate acyltransferase PlsY